MLAIGFRFPAGRYHATPWGRHVNEADVEWPPSPWRIMRGLIATWHRKIHPEMASENILGGLVQKLASELPSYYLPKVTRAHTRHYMPVREGAKDKPVLIFDAFVKVDPQHELVVIWPESAVLDDSELLLLDELLSRIGFLGRAESWIEARRIVQWQGKPNCTAGELSIDPETGEAFEPVSVICPVPSDTYAKWRSKTILAHGLEAGKLKKTQQQILATLPESFLDALRLDTADIQRSGWSQPPGARYVIYQRPYACFVPEREIRPLKHTRQKQITTVRLALAGKPLPRIEDAVKIGEVIRQAAMSQTGSTGTDGIPAVLSGHMPADNQHAHAFYLPESNRDGRIDHILIHADAGFAEDALAALDCVTRIWLQGGSKWRVLLETYGGKEDYPDHSYLRQSREWISVTPYLHPWFQKKNFTVEDQIRRECRERGISVPEITKLPSIQIKGRERRPTHFYRFRNKPGLTQPDTRGSFWHLAFPEPIQGPLALGFGCHFGLGLFVADES